jgi:glycosyltransferase involved in cell wall biosynthesis
VYATTLGRELSRRGHRVTLVTLGPAPRPEQLAELRDIERLSLRVTDLALEWMDPDGADLPRALDRLIALERRARPDVVHLNSYREACGDWSVPVLVAAHSCVGSWWIACRGGEPIEQKWSGYLAAIEAGLEAADAWTAPTAAFRNHVQCLYRPPAYGRVIHNGVDISPTRAGKQPLILAAGRLWDEAKNIGLIAAAAPELPWPVRLVGPIRPPRADAAAQCLRSALDLKGELSRAELLCEMRRAAVFVSTAMYEPFGLAVAEAAASGCALVLSDIPTFRELWEEAAMFFDPQDVGALRETLARLCGDGRLRARLQRAAALRASRYSLRAMSDAYEELYGELAAASRSARLLPGASIVEARG